MSKKMNTWQGATKSGFVAVPRKFLTSYKELGLNFSDAMLVVHIMAYCWDDGYPPFPSMAKLAADMGISDRAVRSGVEKLRKLGLLRTERRMHCLVFHFDQLFNKLAGLDEVKTVAAARVGEAAAIRLRRPESRASVQGNVTADADRTDPSDVRKNKKEEQKDSLRESAPSAERASAVPQLLAEEPEEPWFEPVPGARGEVTQALSSVQQILRKFEERKATSTRVPIKKRRGPSYKLDKDKSLDDYTAHDIIAAFLDSWRSTYKESPPSVQAKDLALAKKLLEEYGAYEAIQLISESFSSWRTIQRHTNVLGRPSFAVLWGYRNSITALTIYKEDERPADKWGSTYRPPTPDDEDF